MTGAKRGSHSISGLFAFALIALFMLFALVIVVSSIRAYRMMGSVNQLSSQQRVALGYVGGKLRASGDQGAVSIREEQGVKLLVLSEEADGEAYETRIYYDAGGLMEQFCQADLAFDPEGGDRIVSLPGFTFERSDNLVTLTAHLSDGTEAVDCVALRAGGGDEQDAV
jgi:hypothetical protein